MIYRTPCDFEPNRFQTLPSKLVAHKNYIAMQPIPVDVLPHILDHLDKASLAKICQLNKICCSYAQDVLYRNIHVNETSKVCETLAQSTHLARRVRCFDLYTFTEQTVDDELLRKCLQNMTNLRSLILFCSADLSVLDGCTFRLVLFHASYSQSEHLLVPFLQSQPSLTDVEIGTSSNDVAFASTCLPNLTRIKADFSWLPQLIPNRPVSEVVSFGSGGRGNSVDLSFFTLSTAPIRKLDIDHLCLYSYSTPVPLLASIFPSLAYLCLKFTDHFDFESIEAVRFITVIIFFNPNRMIAVSIVDSR
jgi:hypothetical protein